jgi:carbon-monoxide dehydrogenase large subunit
MATSPVLPKLVGSRVKRREDPRLIQGKGTYVDDVKIVGMQYVAFKRSDIAHGRIVSIDTTAAEKMEGVEAVFTGKQIAEFVKPMPIGTPFPSPEHRVVATDVVRFSGEAVAVVVASDRYVARDAVDAITVQYDILPAAVDPEAALQGKPVVIHEAFANNVAIGPIPGGTGCSPDGKTVDDSAIEQAFTNAEIVISQRMMNQRLAPSAMEPRGVVAHYEAGKGTMTIWSSTQNPHILRTFIAMMNGMGENEVRAIAPEVGGGFGAKINIYAEEYVVAGLSKRLEMPLKWIEDRSEAFVATIHGRDILGYVDLAAKRDGTVLGLKLRLIADIGAYNMLLTAAIPTLTMLMANATYAFPAIRVTLTEVFTNKTPTDAYRGAGRPRPPTSSSVRWTCWRRSWAWIRRRCGGRTSSRKTSSPSRHTWARCTTRATTRRRSTRRSKRPTGRSSRKTATKLEPKAAWWAWAFRCTSRCAASARRRRCRPAAGNMRR